MTRRHLLSIVVLERLRSRHDAMLRRVRAGAAATPDELRGYVLDVQSLLAAYETAADRLAATQRAVDGEQP